MILVTSFQHHYEDINMILNDPKYCPILKLDFNKFENKFFKGSDYYSGKYSRSILDSKGNYCALETPPLHHKGGIVLVLICNYNLMVTI